MLWIVCVLLQDILVEGTSFNMKQITEELQASLAMPQIDRRFMHSTSPPSKKPPKVTPPTKAPSIGQPLSASPMILIPASFPITTTTQIPKFYQNPLQHILAPFGPLSLSNLGSTTPNVSLVPSSMMLPQLSCHADEVQLPVRMECFILCRRLAGGRVRRVMQPILAPCLNMLGDEGYCGRLGFCL